MDFKCKYCGSVNLELEENGNQTGLYCCDCGKWLKWVNKEEKRVFNNKNACTPIYVPRGATNGDVIKAMFPAAKVNNTKYSYVVEVKLPYHSKYDTGLLFDKEWWNAPYKRGSEKE
jgi:hypothetical protein